MRNDKNGTAFHQLIHTALDDGFRTGINGRSGFVQNHNRRVCYGSTGNGKKLALSLGKVGTVVGKFGIVTAGESGDKIIGAGKLGGSDAFFVRGV